VVAVAFTSKVMELLVYPVIFFLWRSRGLDQSMRPTSEGDIEEGESASADLDRGVPETAR